MPSSSDNGQRVYSLPGSAATQPFSLRFAPAAVLLAAVLAAVLLAGCGRSTGSDEPTDSGKQTSGEDGLPGPGLDAATARAVRIDTTACGYAPPTTGSGVLIEPGMVLTAAHVVAGATEVTVTPAGPDSPATAVPATVMAYDTLLDLALIQLDDPLDPDTGLGRTVNRPQGPPVFGTMDEGDDGRIVGGSTSGDVEFEVADATIIEMDEVRGSRRSRRSGYLLRATTQPGDSGSGLYDRDGRLVGLLFAVSTDDRARSWATAADEIAEFLVEDPDGRQFVCDPDHSRLAELEP